MAWNARSLVGVATLLAPALLWTPVAVAQSGQNGSILGHVFDQNGMPLKGIRVLATSSTQIGGPKTAYTNEEGSFRFLALQPGAFEVRASAPRLKTVVLKDVRVGISAPAELNLIMEVETSAEEVQVVERAPLISTSSAAVREVFDLEMVESLPHGSRDNVHSQVINDVAGGINGRIRGGGANQTIYTQDGFDIRGQVPTLKASAAYEVNTGGYGVDNPMASGGSINMVTKSGSNRFEFELNATADSNRLRFFTDATDTAAPTYQYFINPLISGPIIKDKLWFHFNTEVYYQQIGRDPDVEGYLPDSRDLPEVGAQGHAQDQLAGHPPQQAPEPHQLRLSQRVEPAGRAGRRSPGAGGPPGPAGVPGLHLGVAAEGRPHPAQPDRLHLGADAHLPRALPRKSRSPATTSRRCSRDSPGARTTGTTPPTSATICTPCSF